MRCEHLARDGAAAIVLADGAAPDDDARLVAGEQLAQLRHARMVRRARSKPCNAFGLVG